MTLLVQGGRDNTLILYMECHSHAPSIHCHNVTLCHDLAGVLPPKGILT